MAEVDVEPGRTRWNPANGRYIIPITLGRKARFQHKWPFNAQRDGRWLERRPAKQQFDHCGPDQQSTQWDEEHWTGHGFDFFLFPKSLKLELVLR